MKTLAFYEADEEALARELKSPLTDNEKHVLNTIRDSGAATGRFIGRQLGGLSMPEIRQALDTLLVKHSLITYHVLKAHDED